MKKLLLALLIIVVVIGLGLLAYFYLFSNNGNGDDAENKSTEKVDWRNYQFTDVVSGKKFKISDFKGQNILMESFAVWCPTCLSQQKEMKKYLEQDDSVVHISLNTDPNENESIVKKHAEENNLDWKFAVSPNNVSQSLIDDFGINFVFAPGAPVLLICNDDAQSTRFLPAGVKDVEELASEVDKGCN